METVGRRREGWRGKELRIKEGLNLCTQGEERKITEYIDFFYSLHHLYKYIEPQKTERKKKKNFGEKNKQRNTETHNSSKANRKRESSERADEEEQRSREEERRRGKKRGGEAERARNCACETL